MSDSFKPLSPERAEQIRQALNQARAGNRGIVIDRETGQFTGAAPLSDTQADKVNMIGKFDTHYRAI